MPTAPHALTFNRRHAVVAVLILIIVMAPSFVLAPLGLGATTGTFIFAVMAGLTAALLVSGRFGILAALVIALVNAIAVPVAPYAVLAGLLMAVMALLYGLTSRRGISGAVVLAPLGVTFTLAQPPVVLSDGSTLANAAIVGAVALVAGLWGAAAGTVLGRKLPKKPRTGLPLKAAVAFAVTMALVTGIAMAVVVAMHLQLGAWLVLTLILVIQPTAQQTMKKAVTRVIGTALGCALGLGVGLVLHQPIALLIAGIVFMALAMYVQLDAMQLYWMFVMFLTPGIVLTEGAGHSVVDLDFARLWLTILGAGIAIVIALLIKHSGILHLGADKAATPGVHA